jgi:hypothetical protein
MRTTVTLDSDVERLLKSAAHKRKQSFKVVLNEAVRQSLGAKKQSAKPVLLPPVSLGLRPGLDPRSFTQLADDLEVEAFLSTTQRLKKVKKPSSDDHSGR